jgi:hypothetical protein
VISCMAKAAGIPLNELLMTAIIDTLSPEGTEILPTE